MSNDRITPNSAWLIELGSGTGDAGGDFKIMSNELNEAVWRALGWEKVSTLWLLQSGNLTLTRRAPPQYATSLDACAELRALLSDDERLRFAAALETILQEDAPGQSYSFERRVFRIADATAGQQCRAWLAARGVKL